MNSDVNLTFEIMTRDDFARNSVITLAGVGSLAFILVPYGTNLYFASKVSSLVSDNYAAKGWFQVFLLLFMCANLCAISHVCEQQFSGVFAVLVVISGGFHASLSLVSSRIFGLEMMTSGLTQCELRKLGKLKVIGTVLLENAPQLIFQMIYFEGLQRLGEKITSGVVLAVTASALSICASTLSYLIDRDTGDDARVMHYYISTECTSRSTPDVDDADRISDSDLHIPAATFGEVVLAGASPATPGLNNASTIAKTDTSVSLLTEMERKSVIENRGRTKVLRSQPSSCGSLYFLKTQTLFPGSACSIRLSALKRTNRTCRTQEAV